MKISITVIKFETINGKKTGKSFGFALDPNEVARKCKTEASLNKYIESYIIKGGVFNKADLPLLKYQNKQEFVIEWKKQLAIANDNSAEDRIKADSKDIEEWNHCLNESPALESLRETFDLVLLDSESIDDHQSKLSSEQSAAARKDEIQPNDKPFNIFEFDPPF